MISFLNNNDTINQATYYDLYGKVFFKFRNIPILRTDNSLLMTTNEV